MGARPAVVITHRVHADTLALLAEACDVVPNQTDATLAPSEVLARARAADALIAFMPDRVDGAFLDACPRLRIVAAALRGYDNFDAEACTERGVWLTIVPELLAGPTAELAVGLMIALGRRIVEGDDFVRSGRFAGWRPLLYGRGLAGSTVGIAGMGQLGRAVAERLAGFGCDLVYHDPSRLAPGDERRLGLRYAAFDELLADSHFTVLVLPLNPSTAHLVDAAALARMRPGAILVNVGRGSVVVERDVVAALDAGTLGGYAADVYEMEDWARSDRPREVPEGLRRARGRSLLAPHLGSAVAGVRREIELAAARNVLAALGGARPPGAVNDPRV